MTNENLSHIDITAIESRARALRAQATRDMVAYISKSVRRLFTSNTAANSTAHTAA
jgi:hypothetical protein